MSISAPRAAIVFAAALLAACADTSTPLSSSLTTRETSLGPVLADARGMTLYTYADDEPGVSNCGMLCKEYWPPALAPSGAQPSGDITVVTLDDGTKQWAYKDRPLYTYVDDKAPGDVTGEGADGEWYVVKQ